MKCRFKSGSLGFVAELKPSEDPEQPISIMTKQCFVEMDRENLKVYQDVDKVVVSHQVQLDDLRRMIFPQSFQQEESKVECFQLEAVKGYMGQLLSDYELPEPLADANVLTLCFDSELELADWSSNIKDFKDNCVD